MRARGGRDHLDEIAVKTLPAPAAAPASLQAVTELDSPAPLTVECKVLVAKGEAEFSSLIAIPTG